ENEASDFKGGVGAVRREGLLCHDDESHFEKGAYRRRDVVQLFRNERGSGALFLRGGTIRSHGMAPSQSAAEKCGYCGKTFRNYSAFAGAVGALRGVYRSRVYAG